MLSAELEFCLNEAFQKARISQHEFLTVEHLLLAITDIPGVIEVLNASGADVPRLRKDLEDHIEETTPLLSGDTEQEVAPTLGFQRVLQRAVYHVQSSGKKEVSGVNVLVAVFGEKQTHAVYLLGIQDIARLDVVNFVSHGVSKVSDEESDSDNAGKNDAQEAEGEASGSALSQYAVDLNERAREGRIDPLIGRDQEVMRTIQVLCRRRKNNPLFAGESGVGKTALAEGLAKRIVDGEVPAVLSDANIRMPSFLSMKFTL